MSPQTLLSKLSRCRSGMSFAIFKTMKFLFISIMFWTLTSFSDNEITPLSNLPDSMTCEAASVSMFAGTAKTVGPFKIDVLNRDTSEVTLEVTSKDKSLHFKIGDGFDGSESPRNKENCGFMTADGVSYYVCDLYPPRMPTFLDVMRNSNSKSSASNKLICAQGKCYKLRECVSAAPSRS